MTRVSLSHFSNCLLLTVSLATLAGCSAQLAFREGESLRKEGRVAAALQQYEEAVRLAPDSVRYRMAVANAKETILKSDLAAANTVKAAPEATKAGEADTAQKALPLVSKDSNRHQAWINKAKAHLSKGESAKARALLRDILIEDPKHPEAARIQQELEQVDLEKLGASQDVMGAAFQKPITIEFKDASLKAVFEVFSRSSGINFVFDREVKLDQKTSIFLRNTTIESALKLTLKTNQLEYRLLDSSSVFIYPSTQAKLREYQPLSVRVFYLSNAEAKSVAATLKTILKTRDVVTDDKLNMLIIRDTPEAIRLAEKLVEAHDVAEPEVMLEVEVLEINRKRVQELGIRWPEQLSLTPLGSKTDSLTLADLWSVARDRTGRTVGAAVGSMNFNARVVDSDGEVLANPRIRVRNRQKAKILIGDRVPNITSTSNATGFVAESINYVDVGLKLDVEPVVSIDGEVSITVALEVSTIVDQLKTQAGSVAYRIGTRSAQTVLRLSDGETQVLAGLLSNEERSSGNRVPGLGELPIANRIFGSQLDDANKTEIVLSITPRVLRNVRKPGVRTLEFESGTEGAVGSPGLTITNGPTAQAVQPGINRSAATNVSSTPPTVPEGTDVKPQSAPSRPNASSNNVLTDSGSTSMRLQGPQDGRKGDVIAVQVLMQSGDAVVSVPMSIAFDPTAVQVLSVTEGDFLRRGGQSSFAQRVDPSGQILLTSTTASQTGASGPGVVATIALRLLGSGSPTTSLRITSAVPVGLMGKRLDLTTPEPFVIRVNP